MRAPVYTRDRSALYVYAYYTHPLLTTFYVRPRRLRAVLRSAVADGDAAPSAPLKGPENFGTCFRNFGAGGLHMPASLDTSLRMTCSARAEQTAEGKKTKREQKKKKKNILYYMKLR